MESKVAHNLDDQTWRSGDVSLSNYCDRSGEVQIVTPNQTLNVDQASNKLDLKNNFLFQNANNSTFTSIKLNEKVVEDLKRCGFVRPSPIQATAIPLGRIGIDLIAQSKSGTGKTIVYVVCALEMIVQTLNEAPCPRVMIITPTREIALQVADIIDSLTSTWQNFCCYKAIGGTKVSENISKLPTSQIIVGTPGRICCLLEMNFLKPHSIRMCVLDECDKLMEENFQKQINKIYNYLPVNKQMIVTSATMSDEMTLYLSNYMRAPALVRLNANQPALIGVLQFLVQIDGHSLEYLNFESKIPALLQILNSVSFCQCLVFSNYQTRAKYLHDHLVSKGWTTTYISGDMTQKERFQTIDLFRKHKFRILVSTDLTSRGIDIDTVNLVINVDVPFDTETYLHRIGRAGRFGAAGISITIVSKGIDEAKFKRILSEYNMEISSLELPIKTNLWNKFYQQKLDYSTSSFQKSYEESLKMSEPFSKLYHEYKSLVGNYTGKDKENKEYEFIIPTANQYLCYDIDYDESKFIKNLHEATEKIASIGKSKYNDCLVENDLNTRKTATLEMNETFENENSKQTDKIKTESYDKKSSNKTMLAPQKKLSNDLSSQTRKMFQQAFLNPPVLYRNTFPLGINPNLSICKYLLKGGKL